MTEYRDPTWLVERAWSSFSLANLQKMIELTIAELQRLEPPAISNATAPLDARAEALKACIAELRHAAGMADAEARRATHCEVVAHYIAEQPAGWGEAFTLALDHYRRAASAALQVAFTKAPAAAAALSQS